MKYIFVYFLLLSTPLFTQVNTNLDEVKKQVLNSKILETEREYWVSLPSSYDSSISYPVIYVLDAEWRFNITNAIEKELSIYGKIPPHIVVGITHPNRRLDMSFSTSKVDCYGNLDQVAFTAENSGNGQLFLNFLEIELVQEINRSYSTSGFNILIGHSLGGYFCSYILPIQTSFHSLQIYDPSIWYSEGEVLLQLDKELTEEDTCIVYLSSSRNVDNRYAYHHEQINELDSYLNKSSTIRHEYKNYTEESHNSMFMPSVIDGLSMLYEGYVMKTEGRKATIRLSDIEEHFNQFSESVHFEFSAPIHIYLEVAELNFHQKKYENCIEALLQYLEKDATNSYAFELAGDASLYLKKKKQSREFYALAYQLSPNNERLKNKIENLK